MSLALQLAIDAQMVRAECAAARDGDTDHRLTCYWRFAAPAPLNPVDPAAGRPMPAVPATNLSKSSAISSLRRAPSAELLIESIVKALRRGCYQMQARKMSDERRSRWSKTWVYPSRSQCPQVDAASRERRPCRSYTEHNNPGFALVLYSWRRAAVLLSSVIPSFFWRLSPVFSP